MPDNDNSDDPVTGVRTLSTREALQELVRGMRELRDQFERMHEDSWLRLAREVLTRPLYQGVVIVRDAAGHDVPVPSGLSIRVDTVLLLVATAVVGFGGDRAFQIMEWVGNHVPSVSLTTNGTP